MSQPHAGVQVKLKPKLKLVIYDYCKLLRSYECLSVHRQMRENEIIAVRSAILLMQQNQGGF